MHSADSAIATCLSSKFLHLTDARFDWGLWFLSLGKGWS